MVKRLDEKLSSEGALDHVGWALWQCFSAWKHRFGSEFRDIGYPAFAETRGHLLMHVGPKGIGQTDLVARTGLTKQAVQQALERLEAEGLVERVPDPEDARRRRVVRTEAGRKAFEAANAVKLRIEAEIGASIGEQALTELRACLEATRACLDKSLAD